LDWGLENGGHIDGLTKDLCGWLLDIDFLYGLNRSSDDDSAGSDSLASLKVNILKT